jgi:hypothetical protein
MQVVGIDSLAGGVADTGILHFMRTGGKRLSG